ncbi:unnamed protein product, partial [Closterium sp. NIES-64]
QPLLPHRQLLPREVVNGSVVGQGDGAVTQGRGGRMIRDCVHWCLPGVPDTWNQLIEAGVLLGRWFLCSAAAVPAVLFSTAQYLAAEQLVPCAYWYCSPKPSQLTCARSFQQGYWAALNAQQVHLPPLVQCVLQAPHGSTRQRAIHLRHKDVDVLIHGNDLAASDDLAATMPGAPPSALAVHESTWGQPSIPWLRLLDALPLSLMRPDAHVVAFPLLLNGPPLPHPFMSEQPLLPHRRLLPREVVNGSVVGQGDGAVTRGRGGRMIRDCVHWFLPGVPDTWNQLMYADLLQSGLLAII